FSSVNQGATFELHQSDMLDDHSTTVLFHASVIDSVIELASSFHRDNSNHGAILLFHQFGISCVKKSIMVCQVSLIPCKNPSITFAPISAKTVDGECIPSKLFTPFTIG